MARVYDKKALISGASTNPRLKKIKKAPSTSTSRTASSGTSSIVTGGIGAIANKANAKKTAGKKKLY